MAKHLSRDLMILIITTIVIIIVSTIIIIIIISVKFHSVSATKGWTNGDKLTKMSRIHLFNAYSRTHACNSTAMTNTEVSHRINYLGYIMLQLYSVIRQLQFNASSALRRL